MPESPHLETLIVTGDTRADLVDGLPTHRATEVYEQDGTKVAEQNDWLEDQLDDLLADVYELIREAQRDEGDPSRLDLAELRARVTKLQAVRMDSTVQHAKKRFRS